MAYFSELGTPFISVSNGQKKNVKSDVGNVLKEFETFIFDEHVKRKRKNKDPICLERSGLNAIGG